MVRLKNEDALNELNEEVEDSAANTPFVEERRDEDLAAKTPARFAALLNMIDEISSQSTIKFCGDTTSARVTLSRGAERRSIENFFFFLSAPF